MKEKKATCLRLFFIMMRISAFTVGGGFVIVTFMKRIFVDDLKWLDEKEMLDMVAIAQASPGAIAINAAIEVGWKLKGFPGMVSAVLGTMIPPMLVISLVSVFYNAFSANRYVALFLQGMKAGVAAVILDVAISLGKGVASERSIFRDLLMGLAFIAVFFLHLHVSIVILVAIVIGFISYRRNR